MCARRRTWKPQDPSVSHFTSCFQDSSRITDLSRCLVAPFAFCFVLLLVAAMTSFGRPVPVILDTDIGDDFDDTWALVLLLKSPQFDLKLVTTTAGKAGYRAKLVAKLLTAAGRTDVGVGLGAGGRNGTGDQASWVGDYKLSDYAGHIYDDGVQALVDTVDAQAAKGEPVTIIGIGPLQTLGEALTRSPELAQKANFVGMLGSVRKGYDGSSTPVVEYNMNFVPGDKKVFGAPWRSFAITPLDTCGLVRVQGAPYERLRRSQDKMVQVLLENYHVWAAHGAAKGVSDATGSSTLFDTVAVYLADPGPKPLLNLETLHISVDDKGMMKIDPSGMKMTVATSWQDLPGYSDFLVRTLEKPVVRGRND